MYVEVLVCAYLTSLLLSWAAAGVTVLPHKKHDAMGLLLSQLSASQSVSNPLYAER